MITQYEMGGIAKTKEETHREKEATREEQRCGRYDGLKRELLPIVIFNHKFIRL